MRKKIVAGNWKMHTTRDTALELAKAINDQSASFAGKVEVVIAPPALYIDSISKVCGDRLGVAGQDVSAHGEYGAFTGEFSAAMLQSAGGKYAIVGHSERRIYHGEDDTLIAKKIRACIDAGIVPIYCCGENLEERESGKHEAVVARQVSTALKNFESHQLKDLIIAYEPVWAIGTGKTATADQAQEMHAAIRSVLAREKGEGFSKAVRILYGGSCKPANAASIFGKPDVDGGLIGGAALIADDFLKIIAAAQ